MKFFNNRFFTRSFGLAAVAAALLAFQPGAEAARHGGGHSSGGRHGGGHSSAHHGSSHHSGSRGGIAHSGGGSRGGISHHGSSRGGIAHNGGSRGGISHRGGPRGGGYANYNGPHSRAWRNGWRPHGGYVLAWGDGYDGPGYYYGPPGLAYYGPGVTYYSSLGAAPVEIRVGL